MSGLSETMDHLISQELKKSKVGRKKLVGGEPVPTQEAPAQEGGKKKRVYRKYYC